MSSLIDIFHRDLPTTLGIGATSLIALSLLVGKVTRRGPHWVRLILRAGLFALLTAAVAHLVGSPLEPVFVTPGSAVRLWQQVIVSLWWLLGARLAIELGQLLLLQRSFSREGRMFSDLLAGLLYLAVALTIASTVFRLPIGGLVATSGVIAIVLGLALQSTLADVFSGIVVELERPYAIGDLISLDGLVEGEVIQINWRSVQIRTLGNDVATIPNSVVAKARIVNRSAPSPVRTDAVLLSCDATFEPQRVIEVLHRAVLLCPEILEAPAPFVALTQIGPSSNEYSVSFAVAHSGVMGGAKSNLLRQARRQLDAAGMLRPSEAVAATTPIAEQQTPLRPDLADVALFQGLPAAAREQLQTQLIRHELEPGQVLFAQGDTEASLFIVTAGVLEVSRQADGVSHRVGRISAGDYVGEIGMLTGEPRMAAVTALTPCTVFELRKVDVAPLLAAQPEIAHAFEVAVGRGQTMMERAVAASVGAATMPPGALLDRIRAFLRFDG